MNLLSLTLSAVMLSNGISYSYELTPYDTAVITSADVPDYVTEIYIPDTIDGYTVVGIGNSSFMGCISAEKIVMPDTVYSVGSGAFMSCNSLKEIYISKEVRNLPKDCFFACPSLKNINLPENLESIGDEVFFGCSELDLYVPESVVSIGEDAFGKHTDPHLNDTVLIHGFLVKGVSGSYAETYSKENNIDFIDMDNYKAGDINGDDIVDASDASSVLEEYAKASTGTTLMFTKKQNIVGDINSDGIIDAGDASAILEIYAELSTGSQL
ncbi:MAG: leucine-rich repeat protein [Ruminococcus sp.]|nr:leucine-rich repeat protein [Ruminococcus sp.]